MGDGRDRLGDLLIRAGEIEASDLDEALSEQRRSGSRLGMTLVRMGALGEDALVRTLARQLATPMARLRGKRVDSDVLDLVPAEVATRHRCFPLFVKQEGDAPLLYLGMEDTGNETALQAVLESAGMQVCPVLVAPSELEEALARHYDLIDEPEGSGAGEVELAVEPAPPSAPVSDLRDTDDLGFGLAAITEPDGPVDEGSPESGVAAAAEAPVEDELDIDIDLDEIAAEGPARGDAAGADFVDVETAPGLELGPLDAAEGTGAGLDSGPLNEGPSPLGAVTDPIFEDARDEDAFGEDVAGQLGDDGLGDDGLGDDGPGWNGADASEPLSAHSLPSGLEASLEDSFDDSLADFSPESEGLAGQPAGEPGGSPPEFVSQDLILQALTRLLVEKGLIRHDELVERIRRLATRDESS